ncbi:MAG: GNAT family N-acetyltransferase [Ignavibacteria bacterium]
MIVYQENLDNINPQMLNNFFQGWISFPSQEKHFELLQKSSYKIIAVDREKNIVAGFITAISDGVLSAYIPFLEVIPDYKNHGIGSELVTRMFEKLKDCYMIDILCDEDVQGFYEKLGMKKSTGMIIRNYKKQSGE